MGDLYVRGGTSGPIFFDLRSEVLAIGSDARHVSLWSVRDRSKRFQLGALVGVRGVFGIHPTRRDLAFDGENGLVRILPNGLGLRPHASPPNARLKGTEVYFSEAAGETAADVGAAGAAVIDGGQAACRR